MKRIILLIITIQLVNSTISKSQERVGKEPPRAEITPKKAETQTCTGQSITTENLHDVTGEVGADANVYRTFANSLFKHYTLTVNAPQGWHFTGEPYINLVSTDQDAREAFAWNNFPGSHDRFFITQRNPNSIVCTCWAGSHPMIINLACIATKD